MHKRLIWRTISLYVTKKESDSVPSCADMLSRLFDLNKLDLQLYRLLVNQPYRARPLAYMVDRDRSTVHRSLQRLVSTGLCKRICCPVDGGGRYFKYRAAPPTVVKHQVKNCIDSWYKHMHEALANLIEDFYK